MFFGKSTSKNMEHILTAARLGDVAYVAAACRWSSAADVWISERDAMRRAPG